MQFSSSYLPSTPSLQTVSPPPCKDFSDTKSPISLAKRGGFPSINLTKQLNRKKISIPMEKNPITWWYLCRWVSEAVATAEYVAEAVALNPQLCLLLAPPHWCFVLHTWQLLWSEHRPFPQNLQSDESFAKKKSISSRFNPIKKHPQPSLPTNPQTLICPRFRYLVVVLFLHYATNADKRSTRHINRNFCLFMRNRSPLLFLSRRIYLSGVLLFCIGTQKFQKKHFGYPSKQTKAITEATW